MTNVSAPPENDVKRSGYAQNQIDALHSLAYILVAMKHGTNITSIATEASSLPLQFDTSRVPPSLGLHTEAGRLLAAFMTGKEPLSCSKDGCRKKVKGWEEVIVSNIL